MVTPNIEFKSAISMNSFSDVACDEAFEYRRSMSIKSKLQSSGIFGLQNIPPREERDEWKQIVSNLSEKLEKIPGQEERERVISLIENLNTRLPSETDFFYYQDVMREHVGGLSKSIDNLGNSIGSVSSQKFMGEAGDLAKTLNGLFTGSSDTLKDSVDIFYDHPDILIAAIVCGYIFFKLPSKKTTSELMMEYSLIAYILLRLGVDKSYLLLAVIPLALKDAILSVIDYFFNIDQHSEKMCSLDKGWFYSEILKSHIKLKPVWAEMLTQYKTKKMRDICVVFLLYDEIDSIRANNPKLAQQVETEYHKIKMEDDSPSAFYFSQSSSSNVELIIEGLGGLLLSFLSVKTFLSEKDKTKIVRKLNDMFRLKDNTQSMIRGLKDFFEWIRQYLVLQGCGFLGSFSANVGSPFLKRWYEKYESLMSEYNNGKLSMDIDNLNRLEELKIEGESVYSTIPFNNRNANQCRLLEKYLRGIDKIIATYVANNISVSGYRQEPVSLMLHGRPGTMKSTVMQFIQLDMVRIDKPEIDREYLVKHPGEFIYSRKVESVYFEGYKPEKHSVINFDDFNQFRDSVNNLDGEASNWIRCYNVDPNPLHMANLSDKGNTYFRSSFMTATTNMEKFTFQAINDPKALERRIDFDVWLIPKEEFADTTYPEFLDRSKLPGSSPDVVDIKPELWNYRVKSVFSKYDNRILTYEELREALKYAYDQKKARHDNRTSLFEDHLSKYETNEKGFIVLDEKSMMSQSCFQSTSGFSLPSSLSALKDELRKQGHQSYATHRERALEKYNIDTFGAEHMTAFESVYTAIPNLRTFLCALLRDNPNRVSYSRYPSRFVLFQMFLSRPLDLIESIEEDYRSESFEDFVLQFPAVPKDSFVTSLYERSKLMRDQVMEWFDMSWMDVLINSSALVLGAGTSYLVLDFVSKLVARLLKSSDSKEDEDLLNRHFNSIDLDKEVANEQGNYFGKHINKGNDAKYISKDQFSKVAVSQSSKQSRDYSRKLAETQLLELHIPGSDPEFQLHIFMISCNVGLMAAHLLIQIMDHLEKSVSYSTAPIILKDTSGFEVLHTTFLELKDSCILMNEFLENDIVPVCFKQLSRRKDVTDKFLSEAEINNLPRHFDVAYFDPSARAYGRAKATVNDKNVRIAGGKYLLRDSIIYDVESADGWCGCPLVIEKPGNCKFGILGIHAAGFPGRKWAISAVVTKEMISRLMSELDLRGSTIKQLVPQDFAFRSQSSGLEYFNERFEIIGVVDKSHNPYARTKIIPSQLQQCEGFEPLQGVANCQPSEERDPVEVALRKYCINNIDLQHWQYLDKAMEDLRYYLRNFSIDTMGKRLLSLEEALWGNADIETWSSLSSSSSAGYPKDIYATLKRNLFQEGAVRDSSNPYFPDMWDKVMRVVEHAKRGERLFWPFTVNLKDERYPLEKIEKGKVRLFSGSNFLYLVTFRIYFGAFSSWIIENRLHNSCCVGINERSWEWDFIAQRLLRRNCNNQVGAGDYSGYDGSEKPFIHWAIFDMIQEYYDDGIENEKIRRMLWLELVNSRHILRDILIEWKCSLPSGHPFTILVNCLYNLIAFRYVYYRTQGLSATSFDKKVTLFVLGDDNIWSTDVDVADTMNEETVPQLMGELGLVYTTEKKEAAQMPFRRLQEVEFLKRSFYYNQAWRHWVAPLRWEVVCEIPKWTKKGPLERDIFYSNLEVSLEESALHKKKVYERYMKQIAEVLDFLGISEEELGFKVWETQESRIARIYGMRELLRSKVQCELGKGLNNE